MQPFSFQCPLCHALLRVCDRALVGRRVPCPECGELLRVAFEGEHVSVLPVAPGEAENVEGHHESEPSPTVDEKQIPDGAKSAGSSVPQAFGWWKQPRMFAGAIAVLGVIGIAVLFWPRNSTVRVVQDETSEIPVEAESDRPKKEKQTPPSDPEIKLANTKKQLWNRPIGEVRQQLERLGELLQEQAARDGHFPRGMIGDGVPVERFGWPAKLAAEFARGDIPPPVWEQGWNDPVNSRFVHRRLPVFLNPEIMELVGEDGLPATHFVGMAGVGADAAQLPIDHPRAGIFGEARETKVKDVKDGLAHTILIAGARSQLGGWSVGGSATVRPFVREPYINGPDGFGTGQKDGMWVLMADGRVVFRSIQTDPEVLRSEAAMSDEFSRRNPPPVFADKDSPPKPPAEVTPQESKTETKDPITGLIELVIEATKSPQEAQPAEVAPPVMSREEILSRLDRRIARYKLSGDAKFAVVFLELEEMVAVPLEYDDEMLQRADGVWGHSQQFDLQNVTVGELLEKILQSVELTPKIVEGKIIIQPAQPEN